MLVLDRTINEQIQIGDNVTVQVVRVRGNRVSLGITDPVEIRIHRAEVAERIAREGARTKPQATAETAAQVLAKLVAVLPTIPASRLYLLPHWVTRAVNEGADPVTAVHRALAAISL